MTRMKIDWATKHNRAERLKEFRAFEPDEFAQHLGQVYRALGFKTEIALERVGKTLLYRVHVASKLMNKTLGYDEVRRVYTEILRRWMGHGDSTQVCLVRFCDKPGHDWPTKNARRIRRAP